MKGQVCDVICYNLCMSKADRKSQGYLEGHVIKQYVSSRKGVGFLKYLTYFF